MTEEQDLIAYYMKIARKIHDRDSLRKLTVLYKKERLTSIDQMWLWWFNGFAEQYEARCAR